MAQTYILILILAIASGGTPYRLARRVEQSLIQRSTYVGGWPLAAVPCPSDAPVQCSTGVSSQINQECCPNGNTCIGWPGIIIPVCCPTSESCIGQLQNVPVCANSSWNMYELGSDPSEQGNYFCCEQGQVGVLPVTGYAGICQDKDLALPATKSATLVNQVEATTIASGASTTDTTPTNSAAASSTHSSSSNSGQSSPSSPSSHSSNSTKLGTGAIAGIAVGGVIFVAILVFVLWKIRSRKHTQEAIQMAYDPVLERPFQSGSPAAYQYKPTPAVYQPVRPSASASNFNEMSAEDRRAELGY